MIDDDKQDSPAPKSMFNTPGQPFHLECTGNFNTFIIGNPRTGKSIEPDRLLLLREAKQHE